MVTSARYLKMGQSKLIMNLVLVSVYWNTYVESHGQLTFPLPRGLLQGTKWALDSRPIDLDAPFDYKSHFPSGNKSSVPGSGKRSLMSNVVNWTEYEPSKSGFEWRCGLCGDLPGKSEEHRQGGKYYYGAYLSASFREGEVVNFMANLNAHHNGFFEFYICDVSKCEGEISERCFQNGSCIQLKRSKNEECDSGFSRLCGPKDERRPGRWYLPCSEFVERNGNNYFGRNKTMSYQLPNGFTCSHCVLQWYYSTANDCNPPGLIAYYEGEYRPRSWGNCVGQAGAEGGYAGKRPVCGSRNFPEEYWNCADVRIVKQNYNIEDPISFIEIGFINGSFQPSSKIYKDQTYVLSKRKNERITLKAITKWPISKLSFYVSVDGREKLTNEECYAPFYLYGIRNDRSRKPHSWRDIKYGKTYKISIKAHGFHTSIKIKVNLEN